MLRGPKKNFLSFFLFSITPVGEVVLLKFCMSNLGVVFHIWCKRLDFFWSVRGLNSKIPTYPTCHLAPLSPTRGRNDEIRRQHFEKRPPPPIRSPCPASSPISYWATMASPQLSSSALWSSSWLLFSIPSKPSSSRFIHRFHHPPSSQRYYARFFFSPAPIKVNSNKSILKIPTFL